MSKDPQSSNFHYEMILSDSIQYPVSLNYCYFTQTQYLGPQTRSILISYKPPNIIYVNDSLEPTQHKDTSTAVFVLAVENTQTRNVLVFSELPIFNGNNQINLKYNSATNLWAGSAEIFTSFLFPITYSYCISNDNQNWIPERRHRHLLVSSPIEGGCFCIYNIFSQSIMPIPFYFPPIFLYSHSQNTTEFILNYCHRAQNFPRSVCIRLGNQQYQMNYKKYWEYHILFPNKIPFQEYSVLCDNFSIQSKIFKFNLFQGTQINTIRTTYDGPLIYRPLTIYFSLISLRSKPNDPCGTFPVLSEIVQLVQYWGIEQIHVHIETLGSNNILLDPVQLSVPITYDPKDSINSIRIKKVEWIRQQYNTYKIPSYGAFIQRYSELFKDVCTSDFELYTQFICYSQLFEHVQTAFENGICIITDVSLKSGISSLQSSLQMVSLYSNCIFLTDMLSDSGPGITFEKMQNIFSPDESLIVSKTFFKQSGTNFTPIDIYKNPNVLDEALQMFIEPSRRNRFRDGLLKLFALEHNNSDPNYSNKFGEIMGFLQQVGSHISSSIVVEEKFGFYANMNDLMQMNILRASSREESAFVYATPNLLQPNVFSSYGESPEKIDIITALRKGLRRNISNYAIHIEDFLICCDAVSKRKHDIVEVAPGSKRPIYNTTIAEIQQQVQKVNNFLKTL
ncbi:hypothetical protein GPJ56_003727 [Histomonas meleagridis]|uniref:uncharacterized protein n=1 Tax=Histomonas meleagridis TaxID=135588 RepID=UPI003559EB63|nr:hypothetical protein GPJ56_003727 [Histomonas meleagridis]KAH0800555.1 hypothetical protein GO595_006623 [Histomonas meleagridis]